MNKKLFVVLSLTAMISALSIQAMAHSTIYTDDIGRLHFLGKDPGSAARATQQIDNFANPEQKDLTNIIYKNEPPKTEETKVNTTTTAEPASAPAAPASNKTKGSFSYTKGAMDASNPYTFGETNIKNDENEKSGFFWKRNKDK